MNIHEANRLVAEYKEDVRRWERGEKCLFSDSVWLERKSLMERLEAYKAEHFDEVLEALKRLDTMCREDARFMVSSDARVHDFVEAVIAKSEKVK